MNRFDEHIWICDIQSEIMGFGISEAVIIAGITVADVATAASLALTADNLYNSLTATPGAQIPQGAPQPGQYGATAGGTDIGEKSNQGPIAGDTSLIFPNGVPDNFNLQDFLNAGGYTPQFLSYLQSQYNLNPNVPISPDRAYLIATNNLPPGFLASIQNPATPATPASTATSAPATPASTATSAPATPASTATSAPAAAAPAAPSTGKNVGFGGGLPSFSNFQPSLSDLASSSGPKSNTNQQTAATLGLLPPLSSVSPGSGVTGS